MSKTIRNKAVNKWHVLSGGFFSYLFDAMDIMLLAVALPHILSDLNLSNSQGGLLFTATLLGIGISSIVVGWYSDNYGRRKALLWSLILFGVLTAAIAYSKSWEAILILRFLAGLGLGGVWGIIASYITETWPAKQRGRAASFVLSSFPAGAGIAAFLAMLIIPEYGWRPLFLTGAGSLLAAVYVYFYVPESEEWQKQKKLNTEKKFVSVSEIFAPELRKTTILATLAASFALTAYWGSSTWIPAFLIKERGLDTQTMSIFIIILNVGMFIGYNLFGWLADTIGRKKAVFISLFGTALILPLYVYTQNHTALLWLGPVYAFFISFAGLFGSYFGELYPTRVRTLGAGFCFNVGRGVSAFAPFMAGILSVKYGLAGSIGICALFFFASAITVLFLPNTYNENRKTS